MNCIKNFVLFKRKFSTKFRVIPDENVLNNVTKEVYKPKQHPGKMKPKTVSLPDAFLKAVEVATKDFPIKNIMASGEQLNRYLKARIPPLEQHELQKKIVSIQQKILQKCDTHINNYDKDTFKNTLKNKTYSTLLKTAYNWKPLQYDEYLSVTYLLSRSASEYAVLLKVMGEISTRDPDFKPKSLFDFGSGVGTTTWAAIAYWPKSIYEYFNVDISRDMNNLSEILLKGGTSTGKMSIRGVFYRQFLPSNIQTYDLVVCAYSLLELPSAKARLQTILNLWNKTNSYLIVVEHGTNAGFKIISEIRDYILNISKESSIGYVFSPCPHDKPCPRVLAADGTPCNFMVKYNELPIYNYHECKTELYSYVILKKGQRNEKDLKWPRIVRPVLVKPRHTICRICTAYGTLDEIIFTAYKHGKMTYYCAKKSDWGDFLPLTLEETDKEYL